MKRDFVLVLVSLMVAAAAAAQVGPVGGVPEGKWWKNSKVAAAIDLSDTQVNRLEAIFLKRKPDLIDLRADLEKKQLLWQDLLEQPNVNPADAQGRIDAVEKARARLAEARAMMLVEFRQVLTSSQWHTLNEMARQQREKRLERMRRQPEGINPLAEENHPPPPPQS